MVGSLTENVALAAGRVTDLQLDPLAGFVYWITAHTVEGAHLNGDRPDVLLELPSFSGKQVRNSLQGEQGCNMEERVVQ